MATPPPDLSPDPAAFRAYLEDLPEGFVVGTRDDGYRCPLARFYLTLHRFRRGRWYVSAAMVQRPDEIDRPTEVWERAFVHDIDNALHLTDDMVITPWKGLTPRHVTREEALAALAGEAP